MGEADSKPVKKRVLFLLEAFDKGGIEKVTLDIVNHLDPDKYEITVQTFWYGGHCQSLVHENVRVIPFFFKRYVRGIIRLIQYLPPRLLYLLFVHGTYDVEIAASDGGAAKVISGSTNKKAKKICWVHMDVVARGSKLKEFRNAETAKHIYEKFHKIVCVSGACQTAFVTKFGNHYRTDVVYNPLPVNEIKEKSLLSTNKDLFSGVTFVGVGRLVSQKGFDRLLEVCVQLKKEKIIPFRVIIIGSGSEYQNLMEYAIRNDITDIVSLIGFHENPYPYMKSADVFLLTSRDEAFPLVVGESLILGTPVIATDCCGIEEWLGHDEKYGFIMENSTNGIYHGMKKVLSNPDILMEYRRNIPLKQKEINFDNALQKFKLNVLNYEV